MTVHQIQINMDEKCKGCGKAGAIKDQRDGLCMDCIARRMKTGTKEKERITNEILQEMAGDIEKMLIEKREQLDFAFRKVLDGFKISIGVTLDNTVPPTAEYSVSFPLEPPRDPVVKETVKLRKVIGQAEMDL